MHGCPVQNLSFLSSSGDPDVKPEEVNRVVFTTGKHFYFLKAERDRLNRRDVALVRVETLCPFPTHQINAELARYKRAKCK